VPLDQTDLTSGRDDFSKAMEEASEGEANPNCRGLAGARVGPAGPTWQPFAPPLRLV